MGAVLVLFGVIWFLQGINVLPGSFMTGQVQWAVYGGIAVAAGVALLLVDGRRRETAAQHRMGTACGIWCEHVSSRGGERSLLQAIERGTLGKGSVAGGEYLRNMQEARLCQDGTARWVEVCYCPTPLQEERPYWEQYFELVKVQDAHDRRRCRDQNGSEPWACDNCDCTERLERRLAAFG